MNKLKIVSDGVITRVYAGTPVTAKLTFTDVELDIVAELAADSGCLDDVTVGDVLNLGGALGGE